MKKKKEERKKLAEDISQLCTSRFTLTEKLKDYRIYRRLSEDGIEVATNRILQKYGIKRYAYHGGQLDCVCVRCLMSDSEDIIHIFLKFVVEDM